jgi:DNA-binding winged helix-turn-helix (wHTH) protein
MPFGFCILSVIANAMISSRAFGTAESFQSTLISRMNAARTAVGDSGENQRLIRTIARKGESGEQSSKLRHSGLREESEFRWGD